MSSHRAAARIDFALTEHGHNRLVEHAHADADVDLNLDGSKFNRPVVVGAPLQAGAALEHMTRATLSFDKTQLSGNFLHG
eukprot:5868556-Pyramimonas_sp.AAC.1